MSGSRPETELPASRWLLLRGAQLRGLGTRDVRIAGERIEAIDARLEPRPGERVIEAHGGVLLPGLHDHHAHLFATAAKRASLLCGPPAVNDEDSLAAALAQFPAHDAGWIRGIGFHESVCARLDRRWLDAVCPGRPVRIQHRSGMLWVLNSRALDCLHIGRDEDLPRGAECFADGTSSGRFFDLDQWLGARIGRQWPSLRDLSAELARFGVTGVTDAGARNGEAAWQALIDACGHGGLDQRVLAMGNEELDALAAEPPGQVQVGPLKIYLRESELPEFECLAQRMRKAHFHGRAVAVHCVTRVELTFALAALAEAGALPGDRIEHAAIAEDDALRSMAGLGVTVVTQPHFIAERGDQYINDVEPQELPWLYRGSGFLRHGIALAAGSDAPFGATDPWSAMRAAVTRRTRDGVEIGDAERLAPAQAIALFAGDPRRPGSAMRELAAGQVADLCLLDVAWQELCADLDSRHVALTLCAGRISYESPRGA